MLRLKGLEVGAKIFPLGFVRRVLPTPKTGKQLGALVFPAAATGGF
jgi:hypothetical protein